PGGRSDTGGGCWRGWRGVERCPTATCRCPRRPEPGGMRAVRRRGGSRRPASRRHSAHRGSALRSLGPGNMTEPTMKDPAALAALLADPTRVNDLPAPVISGLLMQVAALQSALAARSIQLAVEPPPPEDRLLTVDEAAALLGVTVDWLRRRPR